MILLILRDKWKKCREHRATRKSKNERKLFYGEHAYQQCVNFIAEAFGNIRPCSCEQIRANCLCGTKSLFDCSVVK